MHKPIVRKRRTREHIIADLSVNHAERHALLCGYTVEHPRSDYGYDLLLSTYNSNGEPENGEVRIQLKATDSLSPLKDKKFISWRLLRSDLARWLYDQFPVILVVYDAHKDCAYWLYVQRHFEQIIGFNLFSAPESITVRIPIENILDREAILSFSRFRDLMVLQIKGITHEEI